MAAPTVTITVRIPPELYDWLQGKNITTTVIAALERARKEAAK